MLGKKIVYFGAFEMPDKNAAAHRVKSNAKALKQLGYEIVLFGVTGNIISNKIINKINDEFETYEIQKQISLKDRIRNYFELKTILEFICKLNPTSIILYNCNSITIKHFQTFGKRNNIKIYGDITELEIFTKKLTMKHIIKNIDNYYKCVFLYKKFEGVIVISRYLFNKINNKNKILIPPLVDIKEEKWHSVSEKEDVRKVIYFGNPFGKDRLDIIINIFSHIKVSCILYIAGIDKKTLIEKYKIRNTIDNMKDRIIFLGTISHDELLQVLHTMNYSCFFRDNSIKSMAGFPTKFVESISSGVKVITNDTSDLDMYIKNGEYGYFITINDLDCAIKEIEKILSISSDEIKNNEIFDYRIYIEDFKKMF